MALQKEILLKNGTKAKYHRVKSLQRMGDTIEVGITCYVDKSYRDKEKELLDIRKNYYSIFEQEDSLRIKSMSEEELTEEETALLEELSNKLKVFEGYTIEDFEVATYTKTIDYNSDEDISFAMAYNKLKELDDDFIGSQDC